MFWKVVMSNSELSRQWGREKWLMSKKNWYFMFVIVFVEHFLCGGNCIQRQKNTGMIGVSFSKSVFKVRIAPRPFSWSPKVCFTATIPYINPNFRYWLGERYTNHTSILLPLNTISPPQNVFYKDHHKHKKSLFLLINHFSRPHWRLSSLFLIITFQNMFPF